MSSRLTFGRIKRIVAILIAITVVLAAGIVVGQAPAIFGVDDDPEASITFEDQEGDGERVVVDEVSLSDGGFVVVTDGGEGPLAVSEYLGSGTHENVTIESDDDALVGQLTATVHQDTTDDETYAYEETDRAEDRPYLEDGFPVADTATVVSDDDELPTDSFVVDDLSAPDSATTNDTIEVVAEVTNPTELETQQNVDFRLDGVVLERQALTLDAEETREVIFEIDTTGTPPGERTIGVYTDADGANGVIDLEFHTDPAVEVVDAGEENVTVDVATPETGFVAIEDENESVIATSDELDPGEHDNVTIEFDENVTVDDDEELTAVVYEGDPDEPEEATALEHDDERVETTFTLAEAREAADEDEDDDDDSDENQEDSEDDEG